MNDSLHPFPRTSKPTDAASSMLASSSGSSNSYNGDDALCFFREWRVTEDRYYEAFRNNGQLEIRLGVLKAALNASEKEASAVQAWLAESNTAVAGEMSSMNVSILVFITFVLMVLCNRQLKWCSWSLSSWRRTRPRTPSMLGVPSLMLVSKISWPVFRRSPSIAFITMRRWR